ncbi:efflux RND transporter permease subunit [Glaesserella parasuis]|uniref:efflux RND transporter permease subunit n=1 Tax=Glaesserella parasuis TaxID=738 RepID=UPI0003AC1E92|nr:efflux RND transporter permease subunit [Glaesserella parasuis]EQA05306.1 acrB/AcrD/AcrF family protein [Glaesserella parasuis 12939]MCT8566532.1 efflux RND transporter permease subunit [Glaesserella parasuis]MCT8663883.1 efflux RND transporter permease subunit [Glaesserella parasuis]MCT8680142.1 efflux RND transporter permease subunit [Glaesserella parasuis]MCT8818099.1 efflux RND transporter permease subunit [Glaesserella parasuis]
MNFKTLSWAIRHPIPIIVLFLLLIVLGIRAFQGLPINADPDMRFPMVNITVTQTGASADELENTVTRRVEDAVAGMAGVRHITSTITEGSSVTAVEKGVQQALQTLAANYPDIQITEVHNSVNTTKGNYDVAISTLLEGAALTVLVVWLFLRNWRATLVAAIALPL